MGLSSLRENRMFSYDIGNYFPLPVVCCRSDRYRLLSSGVGLKFLTFISSLCKHNLTSEFSVKERKRARTHARTRTYAHTQNPLTDTSFKYYYFDFCTNVFFFSHFDSLKWPCFRAVLYDCMYDCMYVCMYVVDCHCWEFFAPFAAGALNKTVFVVENVSKH